MIANRLGQTFDRLAAELAPSIRVNCLAPALTETPLTANFFSTDEKRAAMDAKYPLGRSGQPSDLASMARVLLGPESDWVTERPPNR